MNSHFLFIFKYDCKAREFLYFKLYGKQCITPIAIMTSSAKNNHEHITSLCERLGWFGRGRSSFQLFEQVFVLGTVTRIYTILICFLSIMMFLLMYIYDLWISSLLFQLFVQKKGNGWLVNLFHLFASLAVMVSYGNLLMIKVFLSGFMVMVERGQLFAKSGKV